MSILNEMNWPITENETQLSYSITKKKNRLSQTINNSLKLNVNYNCSNLNKYPFILLAKKDAIK